MVAMSRSENMSRIGRRNTSPELLLRRALWARGLRYRIEPKTPVGRPDFAFLGPKVAVFVDGCFWHGCPEHYVRPRTRHEFWQKKLRDNLTRDRRQTLELEDLGWTVLRVWEHDVRDDLEACIDRVTAAVTGNPVSDTTHDLRVASVTKVEGPGDVEEWRIEALRDPAVSRKERRTR